MYRKMYIYTICEHFSELNLLEILTIDATYAIISANESVEEKKKQVADKCCCSAPSLLTFTITQVEKKNKLLLFLTGDP